MLRIALVSYPLWVRMFLTTLLVPLVPLLFMNSPLFPVRLNTTPMVKKRGSKPRNYRRMSEEERKKVQTTEQAAHHHESFPHSGNSSAPSHDSLVDLPIALRKGKRSCMLTQFPISFITILYHLRIELLFQPFPVPRSLRLFQRLCLIPNGGKLWSRK